MLIQVLEGEEWLTGLIWTPNILVDNARGMDMMGLSREARWLGRPLLGQVWADPARWDCPLPLQSKGALPPSQGPPGNPEIP